jgi:hypothetical protein
VGVELGLEDVVLRPEHAVLVLELRDAHDRLGGTVLGLLQGDGQAATLGLGQIGSPDLGSEPAHRLGGAA